VDVKKQKSEDKFYDLFKLAQKDPNRVEEILDKPSEPIVKGPQYSVPGRFNENKEQQKEQLQKDSKLASKQKEDREEEISNLKGTSVLAAKFEQLPTSTIPRPASAKLESFVVPKGSAPKPEEYLKQKEQEKQQHEALLKKRRIFKTKRKRA